MTDKEYYIDFWTPTVGSEQAEKDWEIKQYRELNPIRSASVYVMPSYQSPVTGKWIDTPSQRRNDLARNGCRPWEGMESEKNNAAIKKVEADKEFDKVIDDLVDSEIKALPEEKKKALLTSIG